MLAFVDCRVFRTIRLDRRCTQLVVYRLQSYAWTETVPAACQSSQHDRLGFALARRRRPGNIEQAEAAACHPFAEDFLLLYSLASPSAFTYRLGCGTTIQYISQHSTAAQRRQHGTASSNAGSYPASHITDLEAHPGTASCEQLAVAVPARMVDVTVESLRRSTGGASWYTANHACRG